MPIIKIVSGGQPGGERGALEAARYCNIHHGGWSPRRSEQEARETTAKYHLTEIAAGDHLSCIEANVIDSDATLVFTCGVPTAEQRLALKLAGLYGRPVLHHVYGADTPAGRLCPVASITAWLEGQVDAGKEKPPQNCVLHVTGSVLQENVRDLMIHVLRKVNPACRHLYPLPKRDPFNSFWDMIDSEFFFPVFYYGAKLDIASHKLDDATIFLKLLVRFGRRAWYVSRLAELVAARLSAPPSRENLELEAALSLSGHLADPTDCPASEYLDGTFCLTECSRPARIGRGNELGRGVRSEQDFKGIGTSELLARLLVKHLAAGMPSAAMADCLVRVPDKPNPIVRERFGDIEEVAEMLEQHAMVPFAKNLLVKVRPLERVDRLSPAGRREALGDCFSVPTRKRDLIKGLRVLLLGDALDSGATMDACAWRLRLAGASRVYGCAIARVNRLQ